MKERQLVTNSNVSAADRAEDDGHQHTKLAEDQNGLLAKFENTAQKVAADLGVSGHGTREVRRILEYYAPRP